MHNRNLISIIIPFYNEGEFIERAVQSVLNQTHLDFEILLIDDGSIDNSYQVIKKYIDNQTVFYHKIENQGPGIARNIGLQKAKGEYLCFLDADDEFDVLFLETMLNTILQNKSQLVIGMYSMIDSKGEVLKKTEWFYESIITKERAIEAIVKEEITPTVWGKLYQSVLAKQIRFSNKYWKEDNIYLLNYLSLVEAISLLNYSFIQIHCRNNSLTRQYVSVKMIEDIQDSYIEQNKLISNSNLQNSLFVNELHSLLQLYFILKIDWNQLKNLKNICAALLNYSTELKKRKVSLSLKQNVLLTLLNLPKYIHWKLVLNCLKILKPKQYQKLIKVKK